MNLLKKLWNFLFGSKEESVVLETPAEESVNHCTTHLRFRRHCLDCLRVVAAL